MPVTGRVEKWLPQVSGAASTGSPLGSLWELAPEPWCAVGELGVLPSTLSGEPRMLRSGAGAPRRGGDGAVGEGTVQLRAAQLFAT